MAAIYPGSFDPITNGHIDILERGIQLFDNVKIVVMDNIDKSGAFSVDERIEMITRSTQHLKGNIIIDSYYGLLVDYCKKENISTVLRGLRALTDFDYEFQMALTNRRLNNEIESVLLVASNEYSYVSSSMVRQIASFGGDVSFMVPENVEIKLREKYRR